MNYLEIGKVLHHKSNVADFYEMLTTFIKNSQEPLYFLQLYKSVTNELIPSYDILQLFQEICVNQHLIQNNTEHDSYVLKCFDNLVTVYFSSFITLLKHFNIKQNLLISKICKIINLNHKLKPFPIRYHSTNFISFQQC